MTDWIDGLDFNQISALATAVSAVATVVIAVLTILVVSENRKLRQAGNSPELTAYLTPHPDGHGGINFVLANVGTGPAFDVRFKLVGQAEDFKEHQVLIEDGERAPASVIPQGERISALFGIGYVLYGANAKSGHPLQPFKVQFSYKSSSGRRFESSVTLDIKQFAGLRGLMSKPPVVAASEALSKIEGHLQKISRQAARFDAFVDVTQIKETVRQKAKGKE